jgi:Domain of Unknown Function (DUF1080)
MGTSLRTRPAVALLVALLVLGLAAATALAGVTVYKNDFSTKGEVKELKKAGGKHCRKRLRKKAKTALITSKKGPVVCAFSPPVQGDSEQPDHVFSAKVKLLKDTPKSVRRNSYVAIDVRAGKNSGYELRVFPKKHRFGLRRFPNGGGSDFPASGKSKAVKGVNKANVLRLKASGAKVIALVNGKKVAKATDSDPGGVNGRKVEVGIGRKGKSSKPLLVTVDDLKLQVPTP